MRFILALCILVWVSPAAFAQSRKEPPPVEGTPLSAKYVFGKKYNLSFSKRLLKYPFNKATQLQLVSFNGNGGQRQPQDKIKEDMPQMWMNICTKPFQERKTLTLPQVDRLSAILYNYGYIKAPEVVELTKCYVPRNGILFLDVKGKVFEFIEICFSCRHDVLSWEKKGNEDFERPKFDLLKNFFRSVGIEYGITKNFDNQMMGN